MGWLLAAVATGALSIGLLAWPAAALAASGEAAQRQQLAGERHAADARFEQARAECRQRFALNACIDDARAAHRRVLGGLKERERALDEGQRRQRALDRQSAIDRRQHLAEQRPPEIAARPPGRASASAASSAARRESDGRRAREAAAARAKADERAAAARKLQAAAEADQARIKDRLAKREAQGRKAQPLPSPGSAPASAGR